MIELSVVREFTFNKALHDIKRLDSYLFRAVNVGFSQSLVGCWLGRISRLTSSTT